MEKQFLGVAIDPRTPVQKAQDFSHEEVAAAAAPFVVWTEKAKYQWRRFPKRDQAYSSSCMAHSGVKMLGVENVVEEGKFVKLSALPVYRARANYPGLGMWQQNLFDLLSKPTACLEEQMPSMAMSESVMNLPVTLTKEMRSKAEYYRSNGYLFLPPGDIDEIAKVIDRGKAVHLIMFFTGEEYWRDVPVLIQTDMTDPRDDRALRHGITAVDYTLYQGKKALVIEDSAGGESTIDQSGQRIITEDFLKARCYGAGYLIFRKNAEEAVPKPQYNFTRSLWFGLKGDPEVAALQKILQYEGFLPYLLGSSPLPLGNFLQMTASALKKWQVKHGILDFSNEPDVRKVRFGPKSIRLANSLYA